MQVAEKLRQMWKDEIKKIFAFGWKEESFKLHFFGIKILFVMLGLY